MTPPGVAASYGDPATLITDDCIGRGSEKRWVGAPLILVGRRPTLLALHQSSAPIGSNIAASHTAAITHRIARSTLLKGSSSASQAQRRVCGPG